MDAADRAPELDPSRYCSRDIGPPPFSDAWWSKFDELTDGGVSPFLFQGALPKDFPDASEVGEVLCAMQERDGERRMRVYLEGERRNDLATHVLDQHFSRDEDVFDQLLKAVGSERAAFMINQFQDHSPAFAQGVGSILASMFRTRGMPPGGVELILFAGNYAKTPFGVHRGYEHAFLCHVGPANKRFPLWSPERFQARTGSLESVHEYDDIIDDAIDLTLEPGDLLYLPSQWFHVGIQDSYSCSVAVGLYDYPMSGWLKAAVNGIFERLPAQARPPYMGLNEGNPFRDSIDALLMETVRADVHQMADDIWYSRVSNGGFVCNDVDWCEQVEVDLDATLVLRPPATVCFCPIPDSDRISVFIAHRKLTLKLHPRLPTLLRRLASSGELPAKDFVAATADQWSTEAALGVLSLLTKSGGLDVVHR